MKTSCVNDGGGYVRIETRGGMHSSVIRFNARAVLELGNGPVPGMTRITFVDWTWVETHAGRSALNRVINNAKKSAVRAAQPRGLT